MTEEDVRGCPDSYYHGTADIEDPFPEDTDLHGQDVGWRWILIK